LRESLTLAAIGIAIGLPLAFGTARLLRSMLFGVATHDPMTYLAAILLVAAVALIASAAPARKASQTDPMRALRAE
jgi:ABC-type antimicrobial peptide transport system permease subunit